jgi:hypothetical protein
MRSWVQWRSRHTSCQMAPDSTPGCSSNTCSGDSRHRWQQEGWGGGWGGEAGRRMLASVTARTKPLPTTGSRCKVVAASSSAATPPLKHKQVPTPP